MSIIIARTAIVDSRVEIGDDAVIEEYVILGSRTMAGELAPLRIGPGARIRSHTVVYPASRIGDRFQTGHAAMIREANTIGHDVSIGTHSIVEHHVEIGDGVRIHSNAFIPEYSVIEEGAWIGPCVTLTNARYPLGRDAKATLRGPTIRRGAKIGANATLLPGVIIGRNALVGAGSVVVRDVPDGAVVVGNPARLVRQISDIEEYAD
jgi:acetyltransferase-like isoleucine patch superfamily enzyme